ncbi:hypothetical protein M885DRAFT_552557, partial [Pelagophyceae sp. CCMP2097]
MILTRKTARRGRAPGPPRRRLAAWAQSDRGAAPAWARAGPGAAPRAQSGPSAARRGRAPGPLRRATRRGRAPGPPTGRHRRRHSHHRKGRTGATAQWPVGRQHGIARTARTWGSIKTTTRQHELLKQPQRQHARRHGNRIIVGAKASQTEVKRDSAVASSSRRPHGRRYGGRAAISKKPHGDFASVVK